jgi:hypothetical protein
VGIKTADAIDLGLDLGYSALNTSSRNELSKNGYHIDVKGMLCKSWDQLNLSVGIGGLYNEMTDTESKGSLISEKSSVALLLSEVAARFRFSKKFEVGPKVQVLMGNGAEFGPNADTFQTVTFLGGEFLYHLSTQHPVRLATSFLTDTNISHRQVYMFLGGIQLGFD